jgi:hypothetical protein
MNLSTIVLLVILALFMLSAAAFEWQPDGSLNLNQADIAMLQAEIQKMQAQIEAHKAALKKGGCI